MKWIKSFKKYQESLIIDLTYQSFDFMESLNIDHYDFLESIDAEKVDLYTTLELSDELRNINLDDLSTNNEFINALTKLGYSKSNLEDSKTYQTFLSKPCKYIFIYKQEQNQNLEDPVYLIFQSNDNIDLYKINAQSGTTFLKRFYDKLSSKTIEILDGNENYIYSTSNGSDWELQNSDKQNDTYKKNFRKEEFQKLIDDKKVKINII